MNLPSGQRQPCGRAGRRTGGREVQGAQGGRQRPHAGAWKTDIDERVVCPMRQPRLAVGIEVRPDVIERLQNLVVKAVGSGAVGLLQPVFHFVGKVLRQFSQPLNRGVVMRKDQAGRMGELELLFCASIARKRHIPVRRMFKEELQNFPSLPRRDNPDDFIAAPEERLNATVVAATPREQKL